MRFTTFSAVTNIFIVSTVALLSLIPAANALANVDIDPHIGFFHPKAGETYNAGEWTNVSWYITHESDDNVLNSKAPIILKAQSTGFYFLLAEGVRLLDATLSVKYPAAPPSNEYHLTFETEIGSFESHHFTIQDAD